MKHISSRQNERVKATVKLRNSRERARQGMFVIDGARPISRAMQSGISISVGFLCEELIDSAERQQAAALLRDAASECVRVTSDVYAKLSFGDNDDGLLAVAETPERGIDSLQLPDRPLIAVLESLEKPGNIGAILRTADAAGLDAVIIADAATDLFNPNTIRASMGTVFSDNVRAASSAEVLARLKELGFANRRHTCRCDAALLRSRLSRRRSDSIGE